MWLNVLSIAAIVLPVLRSWPQAFRIVRTREVSGVSTFAWGMMLANFSLWMVYGVAESLPVLIVTNALCALGCLAVLAALARHGSARMSLPFAILAISVLLASAIVYFIHPIVVLVLGTILAMTMFIPQVVHVFKASADGVSAGTWSVSVIASVVWLTYATAIGKPWIATPHVVMLPCSIAILWRSLAAGRSTLRYDDDRSDRIAGAADSFVP